MADVHINFAEARRFSAFLAEKQIRRALTDMKIEAIRILSVGEYVTGRHLIPALFIDVDIRENGAEGIIGCRHPAAASVEAGAQSHYIFPNLPRTKLAFYWKKQRRRVSLPFVYHPGQGGKGYLRKPLRFVGARYNMLVFTYRS